MRAGLSRSNDAIARLEWKFAEAFGFPWGLLFPYGRSALYTLLRAMGWKDEEVLMPAYICVVVSNAVVLSGNRVEFVDNEPGHFNVPADNLEAALNASTRMVVPTPLFGFPIDRRGYEEAVARKAPGAFVLYDLAQGFGVEDEEGLQTDRADGAFLGLGMGKMLSAIEGGMLLLRDESIYREVKAYREKAFTRSGLVRSLQRFALGMATSWALREPFLTAVDFIENHTHLLDRLGGEVPVENGPFLPDNVMELPSEMQARLGLLQLADYGRIVDHRREIAAHYDRRLREEGFSVFASSFPPTYSQYPILVRDPGRVVSAMRRHGIQIKIPYPYACPNLPGYERHHGRFPNAEDIAGKIVVLPNWYGITRSAVDRVVESLARCREREPDIFC